MATPHNHTLKPYLRTTPLIYREMVAAISEDPLTSSEKDNNNNNDTIPRRPKGRQVSSRYMSHSPSPLPSSTTTTSTSTSTTSSSSRRFSSPLLSHSTNSSTPLVPKRFQSVDRRHTRPSTPLPEATKLLVTSTRSLSVSFQGEAFSLRISKTKAIVATSPSRKAAMPERRRATLVKGENSRPVDQHRWLARTSQVDHLSKSVDITDNKKVFVNGSQWWWRAKREGLLLVSSEEKIVERCRSLGVVEGATPNNQRYLIKDIDKAVYEQLNLKVHETTYKYKDMAKSQIYSIIQALKDGKVTCATMHDRKGSKLTTSKNVKMAAVDDDATCSGRWHRHWHQPMQ
ncbi:hypothetical protein V8G54_013700 [Vigna mungo]|uniref:Uncharacterized protein n=1 Tax=Vigna mungo TaxID=3915 RepID=A0AAQ3NGB0_VIGMU